MYLDNATKSDCQEWLTTLEAEYQALKAQGLQLDMTRGKPSSEQLSLSDKLDGILQGNYKAADGTDTRNYGGLDGLPEAKQLGALLLGEAADTIMVGGNSSLTLMFTVALAGYQFGLGETGSAWQYQDKPTFICPTPGYDRHFTICEKLGIHMITVPMTATGPDMDAVEALIAENPAIIGMWCVPKYSNPTGVVYSDETVKRIAELGKKANSHFRVFWDNAYAVHDLCDEPPQLAAIGDYCRAAGTEDNVIQFGSTSKITHAGSGLAFLSASKNNREAIKRLLEALTIGPDKVNQIRHTRMIPNAEALSDLMAAHRNILQPRFDCVLKHLDAAFKESDLGHWETPQGGYFISFDTREGCAKAVVELAAAAGLKVTPAGATFPYGIDPQDRNIRIAPSVPSVADLEKAMEIFVCCVKLASVRAALA